MTSYDRDQSGQGAALSSSFAPSSSWSSTLGVPDALASYRRSQYIIIGQNVASSVSTDERPEILDEEAQLTDEDALRVEDEGDVPTPMPRDEEPVPDEFEWDHDLEGSEAPKTVQPVVPIGPRTNGLSLPSSVGRLPSQIQVELPRPAPSSERTPLLRKTSSLSSSRVRLHQTPHDEPELDASQQASGFVIEGLDGSPSQKARLTRKKSSTSSRSEKAIVSGRSTFGQTLFNSIAILLGFGMLAEPLAFAYAGWIGGMILIIFYGTMTCYTAKILARIMADDPQIRTYADIGNKAFGQRSRLLTSSLFCLELFTVGVVLVTLFGDSLHSILPIYSSETYKIMGLAVLIPSVFCPLSVLSYASILGILSTLLIIGTVFIDGLSKSEGPGSLWDPAPTNLGIAGWGELGVAFGLLMAGFSGHAVLPSLAKDMANPKEFDEMINLAFIAATVVYTCIGGGGYLMFGNSVSDEISKDLLATPGYNVFLNKLAMWSLVIMPLSKFALSTRPVIITLEIFLGLEGSDPPQLHAPETPGEPTTSQIKRPGFAKDVLILIERSAFTCLSVAVSIFIPEFSSMMAFVGSFSAFMLCVIGPVAARICLERRCSWRDGALMVIAIVMATWGTIAAFAA